MSNDLPIQIKFARALRKQQTEAEALLWKKLRNRKLDGFKFLRQHPIIIPTFSKEKSFYIADFYCREKSLVVEVDGPIHFFDRDEDAIRDEVMNKLGLTVLRFTNEMVVTNLESVLNRIRTHPPTPSL